MAAKARKKPATRKASEQMWDGIRAAQDAYRLAIERARDADRAKQDAHAKFRDTLRLALNNIGCLDQYKARRLVALADWHDVKIPD